MEPLARSRGSSPTIERHGLAEAARGLVRAGSSVISGVGVDIVDVPRIEGILRRRPGFEEAVLTPRERLAGARLRRRALRLAKCLAAKEAFLKAVGRGLWEGVPLSDVELVLKSDGSERLHLGPDALRALKAVGGRSTLVTLSRQRSSVVAFVVVHS